MYLCYSETADFGSFEGGIIFGHLDMTQHSTNFCLEWEQVQVWEANFPEGVGGRFLRGLKKDVGSPGRS